MRRSAIVLSVTLLLAAWWMSPALCQAVPVPVVVPNPGFEQVGADGLPLGWTSTDNEGKSVFTGEKEGYGGSGRSVAVEQTTAPCFGMWVSQPFAVQPRTDYLVTVMLKCRQGSGPPGLAVGGKDFYLPTATRWTLWQQRFNSGELTSTTVSLYLYHRSGQKVWFDNVAVEPASSLVSLQAPADNAMLRDVPGALQWTPMGAARYKVTLARDALLTSGARVTTVSGASLPLRGLAPGAWYWSVWPETSDAARDRALRQLSEVRCFVVTGLLAAKRADTTPPVINDQWPRPDTTVAGPVKIAATFTDTGSIPQGKIVLDGRELRTTAVPGAHAVTLSAETQPGKGRHDVVARATDRAGHSAVSRWSFYVGETAPSVSVLGPDGHLSFNGRRLFPVGLYDYDKEQHLATLFNSGFTYALGGSLDQLLAAGLKAVAGLGTAMTEAKSEEDLRRLFGSNMSSWRSHPALLGYWSDEVEGPSYDPKLVQAAHRIAKELDPDHPFAACVSGPSCYREYGATADILFPDPYPVPRDPLSVVAGVMDQAAAATDGKKPVWLMAQGLDWSVQNTGVPEDGKTYRPTGPEMRCMTYLGINHGARGVCYWAAGAGKCSISRWPERFQELCALVSELRSLEPVLLGKRLAAVPVTPASPDLDVRLWEAQGKRYLIAVNTSYRPQLATLKAPGLKSGAAVEVMFEDRVLTARSGLTDLFAPIQVHVYALK